MMMAQQSPWSKAQCNHSKSHRAPVRYQREKHTITCKWGNALAQVLVPLMQKDFFPSPVQIALVLFNSTQCNYGKSMSVPVVYLLVRQCASGGSNINSDKSNLCLWWSLDSFTSCSSPDFMFVPRRVFFTDVCLLFVISEWISNVSMFGSCVGIRKIHMINMEQSQWNFVRESIKKITYK